MRKLYAVTTSAHYGTGLDNTQFSYLASASQPPFAAIFQYQNIFNSPFPQLLVQRFALSPNDNWELSMQHRTPSHAKSFVDISNEAK
jgi:hypothetical protein